VKNPLEIIKDSATGVWRTLKADELEEVTEQITTPNRAMRRAYMFGTTRRMKGPGYTRAMRKGRAQRERSA